MSNLSGEELPLVLHTDFLMLDLYRVAEGMLNARIHIFDPNRELRPTYEQLTALGIVHGTRLTYVIIREQITITLFDVDTNEELPLVVPAYAMTAELYNIAESMLDRGIAILDPDGELIPNYFDPNNIKHLIDLGIVNGTRLQCISEGHEYNFRP
jgi:Fe2+ transport system protein FeoA